MKKTNLFYLLSLILSVFILFSCEEEDELNTVGLKVYVNTQTPPINEAKFKVVHTPTNSLLINSEFEFPLKTTRKSTANIVAELIVDNSIVEKYNAQNGTKYALAPESAINIKGGKVTIKAGSVVSEEPIILGLNNIENLKDVNGYLVPLKIANLETTDKGVQISSNMSTVLLFITSEFNNIDINANSIEGEVISKDTWTVSAVGTYTGYPATNIIDSKYNTSWFYTASSKPSITIDMKSMQNISGFRLSPNYAAFSSTYAFKKVEVEISKDGENWIKQGSSADFARPIGNASNPDFKVVKFYSPLEMRYLRLNMIGNYESWGGVGEIEVYQ